MYYVRASNGLRHRNQKWPNKFCSQLCKEIYTINWTTLYVVGKKAACCSNSMGRFNSLSNLTVHIFLPSQQVLLN